MHLTKRTNEMEEMRVKHIPLNLSGMSAGIRGPIEEKEKRIQGKRLFFESPSLKCRHILNVSVY